MKFPGKLKLRILSRLHLPGIAEGPLMSWIPSSWVRVCAHCSDREPRSRCQFYTRSFTRATTRCVWGRMTAAAAAAAHVAHKTREVMRV